jgi:aminoglycoside 6'-N-acetyltransferase I
VAVVIRVVQRRDAAAWERMRQTLWPSEAGEHAREIAAFFDGPREDPEEALIAFDGDAAVGFAEMSIRPYAGGCQFGRVAYLEGWFVDEAARRKGVGVALVDAVAAWGRAQACTELASDAEIENSDSIAAHRSVGFDEVERIVCFRKAL